MGLMTTSPSPPQATHISPTPSPDGAFEAPNRQSRAHCWEARDAFFACLERNGIVDSIKEKERAGEVCEGEDARLGKECAASWVTYFKQRRVMEWNKKQTLEKLAKENARPMPEGVGLPGVKGGA
ncbi:hypothetical protein N7G274_002109 [Stereocaulon virgatum]|uniref:Uncharacterized protein n=1 Tax=Stereocaulon virgatum TaxID=373712 RepID=A0ABR4ALX3_9LECA